MYVCYRTPVLSETLVSFVKNLICPIKSWTINKIIKARATKIRIIIASPVLSSSDVCPWISNHKITRPFWELIFSFVVHVPLYVISSPFKSLLLPVISSYLFVVHLFHNKNINIGLMPLMHCLFCIIIDIHSLCSSPLMTSPNITHMSSGTHKHTFILDRPKTTSLSWFMWSKIWD